MGFVFLFQAVKGILVPREVNKSPLCLTCRIRPSQPVISSRAAVKTRESNRLSLNRWPSEREQH